jgi:hypothetical protein
MNKAMQYKYTPVSSADFTKTTERNIKNYPYNAL